MIGRCWSRVADSDGAREHFSRSSNPLTPNLISLILSSEIGKRSRESGHGRDGGHR
jgi:hypothetical protein